jgi:hypothetical protein
MGEVKAIETRYAGCRFRSRLEARWAVFFDALGVKWEYEREGFDLGEGGYYLPDFWLPGINAGEGGAWFEVKGSATSADESAGQIQALADATGFCVYCWAGAIPKATRDEFNCPCLSSRQDGQGWVCFPDSGWDQYHVWCRCPVCGMVGIEFSGEWDRLDCQHGDGYKGYCPEECDPIILKAYDAARSARFEHGESG